MPYAIRVRSGPDEGEVCPLYENREIIVGRSPPCNIFVRDKNVSRFHCRILVTEHRCALTDLESTNGTFVNGERMTDCDLRPGYEIRVGDTLLEFVEADEEGRPITTAVME